MRQNRVAQLIRAVVLAGACLGALTGASAAAHAQAPAASPQSEPFVVEYYYKARWGYADEFIRLFRKNHLPVLQAQVRSGRMVSVTAVRPRYHSTEEGRWDYRVTIVFRDAASAMDSSGEEALVRQLYPDQETFRREEQRRFEILIAHWDVPLVTVDLTR
ncbi:MAG TPA: hypothetical protein VF746_15680 [Longimicrobium sp.]|jgi:hypothetical protein